MDATQDAGGPGVKKALLYAIPYILIWVGCFLLLILFFLVVEGTSWMHDGQSAAFVVAYYIVVALPASIGLSIVTLALQVFYRWRTNRPQG